MIQKIREGEARLASGFLVPSVSLPEGCVMGTRMAHRASLLLLRGLEVPRLLTRVTEEAIFSVTETALVLFLKP